MSYDYRFNIPGSTEFTLTFKWFRWLSINKIPFRLYTNRYKMLLGIDFATEEDLNWFKFVWDV